MKRTIYISRDIVKDAILSNDKLEALAFALQIKMAYISSMVNKENITDIMSSFHMGHIKLSRLMCNAEKFGYTRNLNGYIIANKLHAKKQIKFKIEVTQKLHKHIDIVKLIQKLAMLDHINKVDFINNTLIQATDTKNDYKSRKCAVKKLYKYVSTIPTEKIRLSYARLAQVCNINKNNAILLMKDLVKSGVVSKTHTFIKTNLKISIGNNYQYQYNNSYNRGYLRKIDGLFHIQLSNVYSINNSGIVAYY